MQICLVNCTNTLLQEAGQTETTRKTIALTYAMAIVSDARGADKPDWPRINGAILARWSMSGLEYIKSRAWKIVQGKLKN